jgi:L-alanine-DL-glutamate epimerase-like enolase superfamily enzyme
MKITNVRSVLLEGFLEHEGELWEERLVVPLDLYPDYRAMGPERMGIGTTKLSDGRYLVQCIFVFVDSDEGVSGFAGPIDETQAFFVDRLIKPVLLGEDPRAHEWIWDRLYRTAVAHGRKGTPMLALSVVDCALWDLKGKLADAPVYRLLGGPTRDAIPAYGSALGYSLEPELVRKRAQEIVRQGYRSTKWFFRHGPGSGREGMAKNVELVRTLREAVGDDVDLMFDCWMSWDVPYALAMAERIAEYRPRWIEEPVLADRIDSYAAIRRAISIPVAGGEHEYTRWGLKMLMDAEAADVLQPDVLWAGGFTEMVKICALASTYNVQVIPHGHAVPPTLHLIASQPANVCPLLEFLINHSRVHQFFFKQPLEPVNGMVALSEGSGMGVELDENKIHRQIELSWDIA